MERSEKQPMGFLSLFKRGREKSPSRKEAILNSINLSPRGGLTTPHEGGELLYDFRGGFAHLKETYDHVQLIEEWGGEG